MIRILRLTVLPFLLLLAASRQAAAVQSPPGIPWFHDGVEQAFAAAAAQHKPVLVYWGAQWCPYCHTLKSTVFSRPDFIAKAGLFVPVYLDGDDEGAQRWGEAFNIQGYPTLIVFDADRREIMRLGAGRDVTQYAAVLDLALENVSPAEDLLKAVASGRALSPMECRRLAYNSWELTSLEASADAAEAAALGRAAAACPQSASFERASLIIYAAFYAANAGSAADGEAAAAPTAQLRALQDQVLHVLAQHDLATACAPALTTLDAAFFRSVRARGGAAAVEMRARYVAALDRASRDPRFALADQLEFIGAQLRAIKTLEPPGTPVPAAFAAAAHRRIDAALAHEQSPYVRAGLVNASLGILEDLDDLQGAYAVAQAEIPRAAAPYYYKADLAEIAEKLGHRDEALRLFEEAYRESRGAATRFQWGQMYLAGLLRMAPEESQRIADAGASVLAELEGPDRIYRRVRLRLERLDRALRAWNDAAQGAHGDVLRGLRAKMQQVCVRIQEADAARASCDAFLSSG